MTTQPDPDHHGWEQIEPPSGSVPLRLHTASGTWVRHMPRTGQWQVLYGPMDGATFPSLGMAVYAVEYRMERA